MTHTITIGGASRAAAAVGLAGALAFGGLAASPGVSSAADTPTPSAPTTAPAGTVTGTWIDKCTTIQVTSAGWPADYKVQVRWYKDSDGTGEVMEFAPVNTRWTKNVGTTYRGFSFRITDAAGNWVTPYKEQAAACVVVTKPTVYAEAKDCHTIAVSNEKANAEVYVYAVTRPDGTVEQYPLSTTAIPAIPARSAANIQVNSPNSAGARKDTARPVVA